MRRSHAETAQLALPSTIRTSANVPPDSRVLLARMTPMNARNTLVSTAPVSTPLDHTGEITNPMRVTVTRGGQMRYLYFFFRGIGVSKAILPANAMSSWVLGKLRFMLVQWS